jgi:hypothetical protein
MCAAGPAPSSISTICSAASSRRVLPILDDTPWADKVRHANAMLKSRPRELDDTLAQLVHDDDAVVAASAIHSVARRRLWALSDDLEYVASRRGILDDAVVEAADWALRQRSQPASTLDRPVRFRSRAGGPGYAPTRSELSRWTSCSGSRPLAKRFGIRAGGNCLAPARRRRRRVPARGHGRR